MNLYNCACGERLDIDDGKQCRACRTKEKEKQMKNESPSTHWTYSDRPQDENAQCKGCETREDAIEEGFGEEFPG